MVLPMAALQFMANLIFEGIFLSFYIGLSQELLVEKCIQFKSVLSYKTTYHQVMNYSEGAIICKGKQILLREL